MKGAIFIILNQMVEEQAGVEVWEQVLKTVKPKSGAIYTSVEDYSDEELFELVGAISQCLGTPTEVLIEAFGEFLFDGLNKKYPMFTEAQGTFLEFVESVDGVIHKEVRKLYLRPNLPSLETVRLSDNVLELIYKSPRKLCLLAEGLIRGAAKHYGVSYELEHTECMHRGRDQCVMKITVS